MYIEFRLPQGAGAGYALSIIKQEVEKWAERYQVKYTEKTIKYTHRVAFDQDEYYSLFSMTWNPENINKYPSWLSFSIMNIGIERY
jgi:PhoPQ-activated pathogenicity-related protein